MFCCCYGWLCSVEVGLVAEHQGPISRPAGGRAGGGLGVPGLDLLSCPHQAVQCCSTVMADIMSCSIQRRCTFNRT